jgi:SAM-dependent methyltransferase
MNRPAVAERLAWAHTLVDAKGHDHIVEIGCGPGVALNLVAGSLTTGQVTGVDRSATAIARAANRNSEHLATGRVALVQAALADLDLPARTVDTAFAVNVNVFWTTPADRELAVLAGLLRPGGVVHLVYETPGPSSRAVSAVESNLRRHGFSTTTTVGRPRLVAVTGRR